MQATAERTPRLERSYIKERLGLAGVEMIGSSAVFEQALELVETVAPNDSTVLLQGETGTGKELFARAIHDASARRQQRFITINCAAIPAALLESELFGYERGAFTGALTSRMGRFQAADRGTLFLDEIGDLPIELQPKLLRAIQEQEFDRLGSKQPTRVDVRIVAATNQSLEQLVAERKFRADLYYRLNVFPIKLPSLRERAEDIPSLVNHFLHAFAQRQGKSIDRVPEGVMAAIANYNWPGNIRELQNFLERSVLLSSGPELRAPIGELARQGLVPRSSHTTLAEAIRAHIVGALRETNWVVGGPNGAAAKLGLKRTTLIKKMWNLSISKEAAQLTTRTSTSYRDETSAEVTFAAVGH